MLTMLVRNRVEDSDRWRKVVDEEDPAAVAAGLRLIDMWRDVEDPNDVFFPLRVDDLERARAFLSRPESAETGERAGVLDGEYRFLETVE